MNKIVDDIIESEAIRSLRTDTEMEFIFHQLGFELNLQISMEEVCRLSFFLTNAVFSSSLKGDIRHYAEKAYRLLKSVDISSSDNLKCFDDVFGIQDVDTSSLYYFYLSNLALKAEQLVSIRIDLQKYNPQNRNDNWKNRLLNKILEAFILLVRKQNGFSDITKALAIIDELKQQQTEYEKDYLNNFSIANQVEEAYSLLAIYHLSKALVETASYLVNGYKYRGDRIDATIRQHVELAKKLYLNDQRILSVLDIFEFGLTSLANNAIWKKTKTINDKIQQLCNEKAKSGMIDLLPSQSKALDGNLLDVASNVIVLQMPTSAGKTLMAEFKIIITKVLKPDAKVVYIVPSRALVNQVYYDLKVDLESLGFCIEKTSSAIEIDPVENDFLSANNQIDILVSTPEKLDLLIRRQHSAVQDVSLFILDEAHTIQNGERGAKLELLMSILRRERPEAKFMLLSPFLKDVDNVMAEWLGGGNSIVVNWKPSEKLVFGLDVKKERNECVVEILPTPYTPAMPVGKHKFPNPIEINSSSTHKMLILETAVKQFAEQDKTFLILCRGKKTANNNANYIFNSIDNTPIHDDVKLVQKYIDEEVGMQTTLSKVLSKGIALHHAGMSDETRLLIEYLIRRRHIQYVCATTTISEGVNFPVSTVFFNDYRKGNVELSVNDFWNIVGRAGRTMVDNYGKVILPFNSSFAKKRAEELIKNSSNKLVSVLADLFDNADKIESYLNDNKLGALLKEHSNALSPLIQYFVHLLTVGDGAYFVAEIEDLFKDSLEYYLLDTPEKKKKFISICKAIYLHIQSQNKGALSFADKTGFSVPSVLQVMNEANNNPHLLHINDWDKESVFNQNDPSNLTEKINIVAQLPETKLGTDDRTAIFNAELYARMIISWVKGEKYNVIANMHPHFNTNEQSDEDRENRITDFVKKMNDIRFKASWGLGALEGIVHGNENEIRDSLIPSLVYFGVDNDISLAFRMIGIPRALIQKFHTIVDKPLNHYSLNDLREKVKTLSNMEWERLTPDNSSLNGQEWKQISEILVK